MSFDVHNMSASFFLVFCALFICGISGQFDGNFTLQNIWGRLPSQLGLRSLIQCVSSDSDGKGIKFSRKVNTGQGQALKLPKRSQKFVSAGVNIFLMPADDMLTRFGAFQCKLTSEGVVTEIVTLKLPAEGLVELDAKSPYIVANRGDDVELEVIIQKQLGLPLKWKHNGQEDIAEWDDKLKVQLNNVQESDSGIYECFYDGRRSESLHAILRLIVRGCPDEFYGEFCESECPPCYNGGICHDKLGVCVCPAGFTGENCEQACGGNHFGADCSKQCTTPREGRSTDDGCALYLFCKPDPYGCSCAPGFKGSTCRDHCEPGWYGADCKQRCHCFNEVSSCNSITGACEGGCARGWRGAACQIEECTPGRFGTNCASGCHCKNGPNACDRVTGFCEEDCNPGFMGEDCQTMCSHGSYGVNCMHTCTCLNGGQCSRIDGQCSCEGRWRGTVCNESEPQIIAVADEEVNVGQLVFISCTVEAIPEPIVNITSDKFPEISCRSRRLEQNQYQTVAKIRSHDSGDIDFHCTARNRHGFDQKVIILSVIDPPRLLKEPEFQSGSNTSLLVKWKEWEFRTDEGGKHGDSVEYMVVHRNLGSAPWIQADAWETDLSASIEDLEPNTEYEVAVKCRRRGRGGEGKPSPSLKVVIVATVC